MDLKNEIWEGKTFESLLQDIHRNSNKRNKTIDKLIKDLEGLLGEKKDINSIILLMPVINNHLNSGVKNDELLLKLVSVIQKSKEAESNELDNFGITEEEKENLMKEYKEKIDTP